MQGPVPARIRRHFDAPADGADAAPSPPVGAGVVLPFEPPPPPVAGPPVTPPTAVAASAGPAVPLGDEAGVSSGCGLMPAIGDAAPPAPSGAAGAAGEADGVGGFGLQAARAHAEPRARTIGQGHADM